MLDEHMIAFDMLIAVTVGVGLCASLLACRFAIVRKPELDGSPTGIRVYKIAGALFFGAANTAVEVLHHIGDRVHTFVLDVGAVRSIDATELVALESMLARLRHCKTKVIFAGLAPNVAEVLDSAGIKPDGRHIAFARNVDTAIMIANAEARRTGTLAATSRK